MDFWIKMEDTRKTKATSSIYTTTINHHPLTNQRPADPIMNPTFSRNGPRTCCTPVRKKTSRQRRAESRETAAFSPAGFPAIQRFLSRERSSRRTAGGALRGRCSLDAGARATTTIDRLTRVARRCRVQEGRGMSCVQEDLASTMRTTDGVVAAAMQEAARLTDEEREIILGVLGRDELIRREQQMRVLRLKAELQSLRRKGALKPCSPPPPPPPEQPETTAVSSIAAPASPDRCCKRCKTELGLVINRGAYCRACRSKVCKSCREYSYKTTDWVCVVCRKQM
ncbi:unnamed protein product [Phyllotreta striolata]|uniref:RabBD domain-containing protein n=1 Tax=Phyllotreta striolata TaxID=444603 RepID=A0A9N9TKX5_PHYSR|nr:unnamed protein product [Phyllotreta striolata]